MLILLSYYILYTEKYFNAVRKWKIRNYINTNKADYSKMTSKFLLQTNVVIFFFKYFAS